LVDIGKIHIFGIKTITMTEEIKDFHAETPETITFDPTKKYIWNKDDKFELSGTEFGVILNAFRAMLSTQEAQAMFQAAQASDLVEHVLARAVEAGVAKEADAAPKNSL
jgi:hypothetical protein